MMVMMMVMMILFRGATERVCSYPKAKGVHKLDLQNVK
jgi:hypothetical protein